jgi:hypothetical protein
MTELAHRQTNAPDGESYAAIVGELEQVERDARERRLAAESEAERLRAAAAATAAEITAGIPDRIAAALADLRARHLAEAESEVATIEQRLVTDGIAEAEEPDGGSPTVTDAAVELLVGAVLAEGSD